jgi:translation elongation factor EF-Tu-like GTPase
MNGKLIYKRWLKTGQSKVFDVMAYDKYTLTSIRDLDYESKLDLLTVKAKLTMKRTEEGGRKTGFISGYRPNHVFEYNQRQLLQTFIGDIKFEGQDTIEPGEQKLVTVRFLLNQPIEKYISIGRKWWIHEGQTVIAEAEIVEG